MYPLVLALTLLAAVFIGRRWWKRRNLLRDPHWRKKLVLSNLNLSGRSKSLGTDRQ